jgi:hypothetical protein
LTIFFFSFLQDELRAKREKQKRDEIGKGAKIVRHQEIIPSPMPNRF